MTNESRYDRLLEQWLKDEFRVLNAHLPVQMKSLSVLLAEEYPHVVCSDGTSYLFKKKELQCLADILEPPEQDELLLPILIELGAGQSEVSIICRSKIEEKVVSHVLGMPVACKQGRILLYRPQLSILRKTLRTTTQYLFSTEVATG